MCKLFRMFKNDLNLEMTKGDTFTFGVSIIDLGQEVEEAYFTVKNNYDDETPIFQKELNNGITLDSVDNDDYKYRVRIAPNDTKDLEPKKYYYDFQIRLNDDVFTILKGILDLQFNITIN